MFGAITLLAGLALSVVAAWFAIEGIMAIFAGMPIYAMIMGIAIEAGKVVGITWIYRHWSEKTKLKHVMIPFTAVMMLLTSMGIFGLLSKAHLDQAAPVTNNTAQIERLDDRIAREETRINDAEVQIAQLDETLQVLIDANVISHPERGARVVRERQLPQREILNETINDSQDRIDDYLDQKLVLTTEINNLEREVGPVKYIAAIIYEEPEGNLEEAVRIVIIAFIFVFDPMAILLLMAGNYTIMGRVGAAPARREELDDDRELLFGEPNPVITTVEQLGDQPEDMTANISMEQIEQALKDFAEREKDLTPAEIAQRGMLQEMLQRKRVKEQVRQGIPDPEPKQEEPKQEELPPIRPSVLEE
jgi:hypothetical protein